MIEIKNFRKSFGNLEVVKGLDLKIAKGEIVAIIGSSGSGKSTLLRMINALESSDEGEMNFDGQIYDMVKLKEKEKRNIRKQATMVFQNYHLFKHKTALENVAEGLIINKESKVKAYEIAEKLLISVGLEDKTDHYPAQLSGGQQQRVGIARAMALRPKFVLLDEPTSALDPELIGEVLGVIKELAKDNITMIIVTHEMKFAREIADRILFMEEGVIQQVGSPEEIFNHSNERLKLFLNQ